MEWRVSTRSRDPLHDQTSSVLPNRPNLTVFSFIGVSPVISKQIGLVNWASLRSILCVLKVVRVIWCRKQGYQTRRWSGGGGYATDCFIASPPQRRVASCRGWPTVSTRLTCQLISSYLRHFYILTVLLQLLQITPFKDNYGL